MLHRMYQFCGLREITFGVVGLSGGRFVFELPANPQPDVPATLSKMNVRHTQRRYFRRNRSNIPPPVNEFVRRKGCRAVLTKQWSGHGKRCRFLMNVLYGVQYCQRSIPYWHAVPGRHMRLKEQGQIPRSPRRRSHLADCTSSATLLIHLVIDQDELRAAAGHRSAMTGKPLAAKGQAKPADVFQSSRES